MAIGKKKALISSLALAGAAGIGGGGGYYAGKKSGAKETRNLAVKAEGLISQQQRLIGKLFKDNVRMRRASQGRSQANVQRMLSRGGN